MIALRIAIAVGAMLPIAVQAAPAPQPVESQAPTQARCRWEVPAQFGPRATPRAPVWMCPAAAERKPRCGHYELNLPIWAIGRALPLVRQWVSDRC